jgi:hypothetical protein
MLYNARLFQLSSIHYHFPEHWKLNNLYIHNVFAHLEKFFAKTDLLLVSCEQGEQAFARFTRFAKSNSNHKIRDLYSNFLIQEHFSRVVSTEHSISFESSSKKATENMIHKFGRIINGMTS